MSIQRYPPDHPLEWLNYAKSDLALAQADIPGVMFEAMCFHAQQAAEKALKAILISIKSEFPYSHDLAELVTLLIDKGIGFPENLREVVDLSQYAVLQRYPGDDDPMTDQEKQHAIHLAERTVRWAESVIQEKSG